MKNLAAKVSALFLMLPIVANAGWQVATPQCAMPNEPFFQAGTQRNRCLAPVPSAYAGKGLPSAYGSLGRPAGLYAVSISGSLKDNIERIMERYHWKVIWRAPYDFNFDGRVTGSSLPNVIEKLLQPFPLQAAMYMSNRTLLVVARQRYY